MHIASLVIATKISQETVLTALPHHTILHLSCHGTANLRVPLTSSLAMNNRLLTLRDLLNLKLAGNEQGGIRLAVLSACETGLPGTDLPDEVISLPTGLLQAGVAGVVASLWSVSDLSTMLLLTQFYDLWRTENWKFPRHFVKLSVGFEIPQMLKSTITSISDKLRNFEICQVLLLEFLIAASTRCGTSPKTMIDE